MSMPYIKIDPIQTDDALNCVIASIALQEAGLSHVMNAEGEKIQTVLAIKGVTIEQLTAMNDSAAKVIEYAGQLENHIEGKLKSVMDFLDGGSIGDSQEAENLSDLEV
jgi:hypothetical protein